MRTCVPHACAYTHAGEDTHAGVDTHAGEDMHAGEDNTTGAGREGEATLSMSTCMQVSRLDTCMQARMHQGGEMHLG